jgi:hypothetical protein
MGAAWVLVATARRMLSGPQAALPFAGRRSGEDSSCGLSARRAPELEPRPEAASEPREAAPADGEGEAEPEVEVEIGAEAEVGRNALLVSLRDFAQPDGALPGEFAELIEESLVELISRRA